MHRRLFETDLKHASFITYVKKNNKSYVVSVVRTKAPIINIRKGVLLSDLFLLYLVLVASLSPSTELQLSRFFT